MKKIILMISLLSFSLYGTISSGQVNPVTEYIESLDIEGTFVINYPTGLKALEGTMTDGKKDGEWKFYYPDTKQETLWGVERYANGRPVGTWILYRKDGRVKMKDDLNAKRNDSFNRPSPACMGPASGFHSSGCTGQVKSRSGINKW